MGSRGSGPKLSCGSHTHFSASRPGFQQNESRRRIVYSKSTVSRSRSESSVNTSCCTQTYGGQASGLRGNRSIAYVQTVESVSSSPLTEREALGCGGKRL